MKRLWAPWRMKYIASGGARGVCIFCAKPSDKRDRRNLILHRGMLAYAMMNLFPYNSGHVLIAPYRHVERFEHLTDEENLEILRIAKKTMNAITDVMHPEGFNLGVNQGKAAGSSYEHFHLHVLPRWVADTNFMPTLASCKVVSEHLQQTYRKLRSALTPLAVG